MHRVRVRVLQRRLRLDLLQGAIVLDGVLDVTIHSLYWARSICMDRLGVGEVPRGEKMAPATPDTARPRARCSCCVDQTGKVASPFSGRSEIDGSTARLKLDAVLTFSI